MRIRITRNTVIKGAPVEIGQVIEVDDASALLLLRMRKAEPAPAGRETATRKPAETAVGK